MSKKKRHHYASRFYLDGFVDPRNEPYIWIYEKGNPAIRKATAENIAVQKHYYSYTTRKGEKDSETLENIFAKIEGRVAPIFQKIKDHKSLDGQERSLFTLFIVFTLTRVPNFRRNIEQFTAELMKKPIKKLRSDMLNGQYNIRIDPQFSLETIMKAIIDPDLLSIFYDLNWAFLEATDDYKFVTCDNPLFHCDPTHDPESFWGVGLSNRNIEVTFPISRDLMLLATWQKLECYIQLDNELVRDMNRRPVASASRFVFASQKSDELNQLVQEYKNSAPRLRIEPSRDDLFVIRFVPPKL